MRYIYLLNIKFCILLIATFIITSCSKQKESWNITTDNNYFWGIKNNSLTYKWNGNTVEHLLHGEGILEIYDENIKVDNVEKKFNLGVEVGVKLVPLLNGYYLGQKSKKNIPHGLGLLVEDSIVKFGIFKKGLLNDKNSLIIKNNNIQFSGYVKKNTLKEGKLYEHGKLIYNGSFKNNMYHGYGVSYKEDKIHYKGGWYEGVYNGSGLLYEDGEIIEGKWNKGLLKQDFISSTKEQTERITNIVFGREIEDSEELEIDKSHYFDKELFLDTLYSQIDRLITERVTKNVNKRFNFINYPRMLFQPVFIDNYSRINNTQKSITKNISPEVLESFINEKIFYYNKFNESKIEYINLTPLAHSQIVDIEIFKLVKDRETMELVDFVLDILLYLIISIVIGFIIGFILGFIYSGIPAGFSFGCLIDIIVFIIVFIVLWILLASNYEAIESSIATQAIENYFTYFNDEDLFIKLLGL